MLGHAFGLGYRRVEWKCNAGRTRHVYQLPPAPRRKWEGHLAARRDIHHGNKGRRIRGLRGTGRLTYRVPMSRLWRLRHRGYFVYVIRDLTPGPVLVWLLIFLIEIRKLDMGAASYHQYASIWFVLFSLFCLSAALFHSITWFNLTGSALPSRIGDHVVASWTFSLALNIVWMLASVIGGALLVRLAR